MNWRNSCQKGELKRWKICTLCRKSQCNRNWKFWELKDLQLLIKIQNYQHDAQGLKCQGGRALRNCKQPFNLFIDIRKEWHLYAYMQLCVSKDLLRQKYLYLRLRGRRRWHFCRLYVKCCECGKSVQINFFLNSRSASLMILLIIWRTFYSVWVKHGLFKTKLMLNSYIILYHPLSIKTR